MPYPTGKEIVERAMSRLGEHHYNIMETNCEHFASWARNGHEISLQACFTHDLQLRSAITQIYFRLVK